MGLFDKVFSSPYATTSKDVGYSDVFQAMGGVSNGWGQVSKRNEILNITAETILRNGTPVDESLIKEDLAKQLVNEILKRELIDIEQQRDVYNMNDIFRARVKVSPPESQNEYSISYENVFKIQDKEFTAEQVQTALEETFPEYFI